MANDVFANGREISCKAGSGKSICAFPDVCFTPPENPTTPPGVPIPYPNTGMTSDTTSGSKNVKVSNKEVMLKNKSYFKKSTGDEAGSAAKKGVVTSVNRGKVYFNSWSMDVKIEGQNVVRHLDLTTHNHASQPGQTPPWPYADTMAFDAETTKKDCTEGHSWKEISREGIDETKKKNSEEAKHLESKPSKAHQAQGPLFENAAIDDNMEKLEIQATSAIYKCTVCGAEQEVDIVGKNQIAEAKSRNANQVKKKGKQSKNYKEIQKQLIDKDKNPVAKLNGNKSDVDESKEKYIERGFDVEVVPTSIG
jgi:hypothetical protein